MTMDKETDQVVPEDRWLDQLVDDELDERTRRELLVGLELRPDGWRKCALAFLEAQAWRRALGGLAADVHSSSGPATAVTTDHRNSDVSARDRQQTSRFSWLSMAACVFVAFVVGAGTQHVFSRHQSDADPRIVQTDSTGDERPTDLRSAPEEGIVAPESGAGTLVESIPARPVEEPTDVVKASPSPAQLFEAWKRSGHRVHRQRGVVPFNLKDGRQGFVPVEDLYVVPTNLTTY